MRKYLLGLMVLSTLATAILIRNFGQRTTNTQASEPIIPTIAITPTVIIPTLTPTPEVSSRGIYIGMWTQGFWDDNNKILNTATLIQLEKKLEKKFAVAHYYRGWEALQSEAVIKELNEISANGWRPMLSANPYFFAACQWTEKGLYKTIAEGQCDNFLRLTAKNLKRFTQPLFLRWAWEMNLPANEWGMKNTNSSPQDFVNAWRHMHEIYKQEGASNILWVWSPNSITPDSIPYAQLYPGNEYVDWTAIDVYNWGKTQSWSSWQPFHSLFRASYAEIVALASDKPLMIAEVNTTHLGGSKALWYSDLLETQIPDSFPAVKAVVFYNEDRSVKEGVNWLIDVTPESLASFKSGIQAPFYLSSF